MTMGMGTVMVMMDESGQGQGIDRCGACGSVCGQDWVSESPFGRGSLGSVGLGVKKGAEPKKIHSSAYPRQRCRISSAEYQRSLAFHPSAACSLMVESRFAVKGGVEEWTWA